jgi:transcriptional regulator with XRE-family HTH domain
MIRFQEEFLESFLAVMRKYMQLRGGLTQKDLSEMTNVGISTMSRFLNLKTSTIDEQLVANIIATLNIPLHEVIDGVEEESTDTLKKLVNFYKDQIKDQQKEQSKMGGEEESKKTTFASINVAGKKQQVHFGEGPSTPQAAPNADLTIREKLQTLSPRQKTYLSDFLNLDQNDRDLVVDLGNAVFRYFQQRSVDF